MPTIKSEVLVSAISEMFLALRVPADPARVVAASCGQGQPATPG